MRKRTLRALLATATAMLCWLYATTPPDGPHAYLTRELSGQTPSQQMPVIYLDGASVAPSDGTTAIGFPPLG
jgi:hypothetical protein